MKRNNSQGRQYSAGKALGDDLRGLIVHELKESGVHVGNSIPKGIAPKVAEKYKITKQTVHNIWKKYNEDLSVSRRPCAGGRPRKYGIDEIEFVNVLKTERPSVEQNTLRDQLLQYSAISSISTSTVSRIITNDLKMTYKRITHYKKNRFTVRNLQYTQQFLNYVSNKDPFTLKFMDEMGVKLVDGQPVYGHSRKGTPCVEITRYDPHANFTASLIIGITGVKYVKIIEGASDSGEYLQFIGEASQSYTNDGESVFQPGECLVVDNAPTHHNMSERVLRNWLPTVGMEYLFLPAYSPDLNPAEQCFRKVKKLLKSDRFGPVLRQDLKVAVYKAFNEITLMDTRSFFKATEYMNI